MAYPIITGKFAATANSTSETFEFGFTVSADELIVIHAGWRSTSATLAISGFTALDSRRTNDAWSSQVFVKKAVGGETSAALTFSASSFTWGVIAHRCPHADTAVSALAAIDGIAFNAGATSATLASPALITTVNDCALLHFSTWDLAYQVPDHESINVLALAQPPTASQTFTTASVGYQATAGAIPTWNYSASNAANAGLSWVVAVKNAAGGSAPIVMADGRKYLQQLGGFAAISGGAPDSVVGLTAIAGIPMGASTVTSTTLGVPQAAVGVWGIPATRITSVENLSAITYPSGAFVGLWNTMAAINASGKTIILPFGYGGTVDNTRVGPLGSVFVVADAANNWAAYQIEAQVKWSANGARVLTINAGGTTPLDGSVTPVDFTALTACFYGYHRKPATTTSVDLFVASPAYVNTPCVFTRGGASNQIKVKQIARYLNADGLFPEHAPFQGAGQMIAKFGLQIGDGTAATVCELTTQSFETPSLENTLFQAGANTTPIVINASASSVIDWSSAIVATEYANTLTIDAASSTSATYGFQGCSIIGYLPTWKTGVPCVGVSFKRCDPVAFKGANVTNCSVTNTLAGVGEGAVTFDTSGATAADTTIDLTGTSAGHHISLGASVTAITLNTVTLSGAPGVSKIYSALASGVLTITADGLGTALAPADVTFIGGSTATAVIAAPTVNQSVTVNNLVTGSRVQIYDTTNNVELANAVETAGVVSWTDGSAAVAGRDIRVRIALVSGVTAYEFIEAAIGTAGTTESTAALSYRANQVADASYNTNAINGSLVGDITFTDAATDLINIAIAGGSTTWPRIYAAFAYWISTATGITDDIAYIQAPDTANYMLTAMKVKNTSSPSVALTITGGYGRDATTGSVADIVDITGGNIYPLVDHVVAYATGSALTAGQDAALTAVKASTDAYLDATVSSRLATAGYTAPDNASVTAIKAKTDSLAFTVAGKVDANMTHSAATELHGNGTEANKFRSILVP